MLPGTQTMIFLHRITRFAADTARSGVRVGWVRRCLENPATASAVGGAVLQWVAAGREIT